MGRRAQKAGAAFERYLDAQHALFERQGRACIAKVPTPTQITGSRGRRVTARKEPKVWVDYTGLLDGGQAVAFDAKSTKAKTSFPFSMVSDFQRDKLATVAKLGGLAFLLVRRREVDGTMRQQDYLYPVDSDGVIAETTDRKSIRWDTSERYRIAANVSWLDHLEAAMADELTEVSEVPR